MIVDIEDNNMIINVYKKEVGKRIEKRENQIEFSSLNNNDPFVDSDLPVKLDEQLLWKKLWKLWKNHQQESCFPQYCGKHVENYENLVKLVSNPYCK